MLYLHPYLRIRHHEISFEEQQHTESLIFNADVVMKSPGIPEKVSIIQKLIQEGIPVISEIEFTSNYTEATIIGIKKVDRMLQIPYVLISICL